MAAFFGKQHKDVLKAIRNLLENLGAEMRRCFVERSEEVQRTFGGVDVRPFYEMTHDGFTLLAMGFTGEKALAFKIAYIERFNRMETLLRAEAVAALSAEQVAELVDRRVGELLRDQRAVLAEGFVTAHDIRAQHVADQKHGPRLPVRQ